MQAITVFAFTLPVTATPAYSPVSEKGLAYADYTTTYSAFGSQLGCMNPGTGEQSPGPDMVGFSGEWGNYTDNAVMSELC